MVLTPKDCKDAAQKRKQEFQEEAERFAANLGGMLEAKIDRALLEEGFNPEKYRAIDKEPLTKPLSIYCMDEYRSAEHYSSMLKTPWVKEIFAEARAYIEGIYKKAGWHAKFEFSGIEISRCPEDDECKENYRCRHFIEIKE